MAKCRGCGTDTTEFESDIGWMHYRCEIDRLSGLFNESRNLYKYLEKDCDQLRACNAALEEACTLLHDEKVEYQIDEAKSNQRITELEAEVAWLRKALEAYKEDRCEDPIRERITPTKYKEEWILYDCTKCKSCRVRAALAAKEG